MNIVFHIQLDIILRWIGFDRSAAHSCLYKWVVQDVGFIILTEHVDDGIMLSDCGGTLYTEFEAKFKTRVKKMSMSLEFKRFLGMDVTFQPQENGGKVELSHYVYITTRYFEFLKAAFTPMSENVNLRDAEANEENE